jgi:PAS domain S-box-containing protein
MLGHHDRVMSRIGTGGAYWKYIKTLPVGPFTAAPVVIHDVRTGLPEGADLGALTFFASAPIHTLCGERVGVLVIADALARPEFSAQDLETLVDLAGAISVTMEVRMIASQSLDSRLRYAEAEQRFRDVANSTPALIACNDADGSCGFVNDSWLEFTGRSIKDELGDGWQQTMHDLHRQSVLNLYWQGFQTRQPFAMEVPMRRHDGVFRWMQGTGTPRILNDRTLAGFLVRLTEVSDWIEYQTEC